jgi:fermentation-respiration switch protein FrsA (DUF1100 family)
LVSVKVARLFTDLSVRLGFTLSAEAVERLTESPPTNVEDFTDEILRAEGLDPLTTDSALRGEVRKLVGSTLANPNGLLLAAAGKCRSRPADPALFGGW